MKRTNHRCELNEDLFLTNSQLSALNTAVLIVAARAISGTLEGVIKVPL